jgi:hypothetical protein
MEMRDGTMVMASVPSIVCWESSEHRALVGASIASLIVYVMGVPAVTFGTVLYARRKDLLKKINAFVEPNASSNLKDPMLALAKAAPASLFKHA